MEPAFARYPESRAELAEQLDVVFEAYEAEGPPHDSSRDGLEDYILGRLGNAKYRDIVAELHPRLSALVARVMPPHPS